MGYTPDELEAYAAAAFTNEGRSIYKNDDALRRTDMRLGNQGMNTIGGDDGDYDDSIFLDPDLYAQSRELLNPIGFMNPVDDNYDAAAVESTIDSKIDQRYREVMQNFIESLSSVPDSKDVHPEASELEQRMFPFKDKDPTMDDLWSAIKQSGINTAQHYSNPAASEELHRQVFAEEEGFIQNSPAFLEALTDSSKADQAAAERRGQLYRERQEKAIKALEQQIEEFESTILQQQKQDSGTAGQHCSQCYCLMSDDEVQAAAATKSASNSSHQLLCRVCYKDVLIAESKKAANDDEASRQQRARALMRTFRQTGTIPVKINPASISSRTKHMARKAAPLFTKENESMPIQDDTKRSRSSKVEAAKGQPPVSRQTTTSQQPFQQRPTRKTSTSSSLNPQVRIRPNVRSQPRSIVKKAVPKPWVERIDPETGEVFYWNEKTQEMRWEL